MRYDKQAFQQQLSALINEKIIGVFFQPHVDDLHYPALAENNMEYCKSYGFFLQTKKRKWFSIYETDYSHHSYFTGIQIAPFEHEKVMELEIGKNQIKTDNWENYRYSKIESIEVYEDEYSEINFVGTLPVGISLHFSNQKSLHILNLCVESFDKERKLIDFSRGYEVLILFNEADFLKLGIGKNNKI